MGTPVVSLAGTMHVSRMGTSILTHAGLGNFIAFSREEYLNIARYWAERSSELADLRDGLRAQIELGGNFYLDLEHQALLRLILSFIKIQPSFTNCHHFRV